MPELSIIVPVYNVEKYLIKCIDSILQQTFTDFELILVDDESPDRCGMICDEYAKKDSRIKVIHQKHKGVSAARNAALDIAKGTYLGFVDPDDWIEKEMYHTMMEYAVSNAADVVVCGVNYFTVAGEYIRSDLHKRLVLDRNELLIALYSMPNPIGGADWNKIFLRSKVRNVRFRENMCFAEDWTYLFECFKYCDLGYKIPDLFYNVTERLDSTTRKDRVSATYNIVKGGETLLQLAHDYSYELEKYATDKYLDNCLRYSKQMCLAAQSTKQFYRWKYVKIRMKMFRVIMRAALKKLLPGAKIRGYLVELFRS